MTTHKNKQIDSFQLKYKDVLTKHTPLKLTYSLNKQINFFDKNVSIVLPFYIVYNYSTVLQLPNYNPMTTN